MWAAVNTLTIPTGLSHQARMWGRGEHLGNPNGIESPSRMWGRGEDIDNPNGIESPSPGLRVCELPWVTGPTNIPNRNAVVAIPFSCASRERILPQPRC